MMICYAQGKRKGTNGKYTFPAAFFDVPAVVCNPQQWYVLGENSTIYKAPYIGVKNITKTGFEVDSNSIPNTYIAIGLWEGTATPHPDGVKVTFKRHQTISSNPSWNLLSAYGDSAGSFTVLYTDESGSAKTITNPISLWVRYGTTITIYDANSNGGGVYTYSVHLYDKDGNKLGTAYGSSHTITRTITEDTTFQVFVNYSFNNNDNGGGA